ncbi:hypothetical protein ES711_04595 [Gelidibacter salicanalis]|uniref:Alpha/beta hydrolase n=1 Tax=Gelidibacter salicanalis TaxID=291193 RepID=A0A5C7AKF2_9FLAO|nr:YqiA/YcfP family alpha/beta fold hydrolase [Gelidibacter salicanalis]TXE09216.1 hypothetical protein ES711_04595 [Gelidibacter salicanalis]
MNILYIHGLNGSLTPEKRTILEHFGTVKSPSLDYENNADSINSLYTHFKDAHIDMIIGSSMGGFAGYHLSKLLRLPCLIFNPALADRSVYQTIPTTGESSKHTLHLVLGSQDSVVNPKGTLDFLANLLHTSQDYSISIRHDLEHRIPITAFEEEVAKFMAALHI